MTNTAFIPEEIAVVELLQLVYSPLEDFGDAPDPTYPTLLASDGARHQISAPPWLFLGAGVDGEPDGQPDASATGDDLDINGDDEDGVTFTTPLILGNTADVRVWASAEGLLDAWVDFNGNGDWSNAGEQIFTSEPLAAGANNLSFGVPAGANPGSTFARFRISENGGLSFDGFAPVGEVEDYEITISGPANQPPVADANGPYNGIVGVPVTLDGSGSSDPDGDIILYEWDFNGDGTFDYSHPTDPITTYAYPGAIVCNAVLRVTDAAGQTDTDSAAVTISEAAPVVEVGGNVYPADRLTMLVPWILLAVAVIAGTAIAVKRRGIRS